MNIHTFMIVAPLLTLAIYLIYTAWRLGDYDDRQD